MNICSNAISTPGKDIYAADMKLKPFIMKNVEKKTDDFIARFFSHFSGKNLEIFSELYSTKHTTKN